MVRLGNLDIQENVDGDELAIRLQYRAMPNLVGFSMFSRAYAASRGGHFSIVENTFHKRSDYRWQEWFRDF